MNRKKINLEIIKRKEKKRKIQTKERRRVTLSLFFWMFLWIVDDYLCQALVGSC
jgi:hypothetical protein